MASFGVTSTGFQLKRLRDILDSLQADLVQIQDPVTGETLQVDFNEADPFIQAINSLADNNAKTWELAQAVSGLYDPSSATNAALSVLVQMNGLTRRPGRASTIPIQYTGTAGIVIAAGQRISDAQQNTIFTTDTEVTIGAGGTVTGTASSITNGAIAALDGTITTILTPISGWSAVTNTADATLGAVEETDRELRTRRNRSTEAPSVGPVEAIQGNLTQIEGVTFSRTYVNNTLATDSRGLPAKTIGAVIQGGDNTEIARTLFLRAPAGLDYFGTTTETITDNQGETYIIRWIRPTNVDIDVQVDVTVTDASQFPTDGATRITEAIVSYAQGGAPALGITEGFEDLGFVPGVDVTLSRLYTPINSVPGHRVDTLQIAINGNPLGTSDITIDFDEVAAFASSRITVNVTTP